ncbi:MAG: hypothetical protein ACP5HD_10665, partial [Thermoproteus sp.]
YYGHTAALYKSDRPYIIVDGAKYVGYGDMYGLTPPAAVSENGVLAFATYDALYWGGKWIPIRPGAAVLAISGDGRVVAVGYLDKVYVYYDGRLAAEIPAQDPRSIALDYDGLVMAVQDDAGIHPYIFEVVNATVLGCPYGLLRAGAAIAYNVTGSTAVFVPKGQPLVPLTVNGSGWICLPQQQAGNTFVYKMYYTVGVVPPAAGPPLAAGPTAYSAPLTAKVASNIGDIKARLAGWLVGNRTYPPLATLVVDIEGPTAVAPLYELEIVNSTVVGQTKMVLLGYTAYGPNGMPLAPYKGNVFIGLPAYVYAQYVNYSLFYVYSLTPSGAPNETSVWLAPGATAYIETAASVDFGNGTRLVFLGWSDGVAAPARTVGPGAYIAVYKKQYLVNYTAPNFTRSVWVDAGARPPNVTAPALLYDDGRTRIYFVSWNLPNAVNGPAKVTANVAYEYHVTLQYPWGEEDRWLPQGYLLETPPERYRLFWVFAGWSPSSAVNAPGVYTAVYQLDWTAIAAVAAAAAASIAGAVVWRRRR